MPFNVRGTIPWDYTVDSINASGKTLVALDKPEFRTSERSLVCYVATVGDCFRLEMNSTLTADNITVVNAAGGTGRWVRCNVPNPDFFPKLYWAIDPVSGNDENQGWGANLAAADAVPLKTLGELDRRLSGHPGYDTTCVFHVLNNIPTTDSRIMLNAKTKGGSGFPAFIGKLGTPLFTGTITGYATEVPGSNTGHQVTISGIPTSWTASGLVGKMIQKSDGSKRAFVIKDLGSKTALVKQPMALDLLTFSSVGTNFVNGETVSVYNLYTIPNYPFVSDCMYAGLELLEIQGQFSNPANGDLGILGSSSPWIYSCIINGVNWQGSVQGLLSNCLFASNTSVISNANLFNLDSVAFLGITTTLVGCISSISKITTQVNAQMYLDNHASVVASDSSANYAIFDSSSDGVVVNRGSSFTMNITTQKVYGTGNSGYVFKFHPTSDNNALPVANCTATSSQAKPISAVSVEYAYADLPIINITKNCIVGVP